MLQTILNIPHWIFQGPLLIAWLVIGALMIGYFVLRGENTKESILGFLPVYALVSLVIHFALPRMEIMGINPDDPTGELIKTGLAIRGYGVCMLLAIVSGVGLVLTRCGKVGLNFDQIVGLGFWMMISGIVGARLFYVFQKSDEFFVAGASFGETLVNVVDMTKGGLVVYGSLIGATIVGFAYMKLNKLPVLRTADLIAPGMVLGLAIGRVGCLLNGCCYGGVCEAPLPAVQFPAGSAPYMTQLVDGELIGIQSSKNPAYDSEKRDESYRMIVDSIEPDSIADQIGLKPGDQFAIEPPGDLLLRFQHSNGSKKIDGKALVFYVYSDRLDGIAVPVSDLPVRSLSTHPTQIYSAINALLLCLTLYFYWTIKKSDGEVFGLMLILYPIARFLLELIRQDEMGQFGTELTISQWVSVGMILFGFAVFAAARGGLIKSNVESAAAV